VAREKVGLKVGGYQTRLGKKSSGCRKGDAQNVSHGNIKKKLGKQKVRPKKIKTTIKSASKKK